MKRMSLACRWLAFLSFLLLVVACSSSNEGTSAPAEEGEGNTEEEAFDPNSPLDLDWMVILYHQQPPKDTVIKEIEELTNTNLDLIWVPDAVKEDRVNAALASGNLPKVITLQDFRTSSVLNAFRSGQFWEIGPYLDEFPNLSEMNETILENVSVDGKIYGIYRERPLSRQGVVIRQDWLENLGLEMPTNLEELYEVARAFTYDDPNGSGADDTVGFTDRNDLIFGAFKTLASYHGTPNEWGFDDEGKLMPEFMTDEYVETMNYMKSLYDEGLINTEFPVTSKEQQQELFMTGRAGIYVGNMVDARNLRDKAKDINPEMEVAITNRIAGPDGEDRVWAQGGHNGIFAIPKSSVETEAELKRILAFFDRIAEEDVYNLMAYGIEDVHYETIDGEYFERIEENLDDWAAEVQPLVSLVAREMNYLKAYGDPLYEEYERLTEDNNEIIVTNPAEPLFSPTYTERGTELQKIIDDATYKYILGELDEDGFEAEVERWLTNGGESIIEELNEDYERLN
ncbi:extracellular solute-binding protein [Halalkalibacterium halodurans]|uniref:Peptide ABC transporter substrate-binding protein n=1 Tax=Halalkalibacterium halodurans TaxID=86665 RepID=A0A0M0KEK8_ALKHA|nr:extracellular solute-binding protein [Halalkalibacterium halodurans]TPE69793.1 extracellular solute-binding protein [Halalkalibacterium halodurans]